MSLGVDADKPFQYDSDLRRLVLAVRDATGHDETEWIEWKVAVPGVDSAGEPLLTSYSDEFIATNILGFANRSPDVAGRWAAGQAYLLVGVTTGEIRGIVTTDREKIHSRVSRYVGGRIAWRPEYAVVEGKSVLVIIVDPPRWGDSIHTLQKGMQKYQAGVIFVRHPGKTEQASPHDVEMLEARSAAKHARWMTLSASSPTGPQRRNPACSLLDTCLRPAPSSILTLRCSAWSFRKTGARRSSIPRRSRVTSRQLNRLSP